jgi:hypothetical protein
VLNKLSSILSAVVLGALAYFYADQSFTRTNNPTTEGSGSAKAKAYNIAPPEKADDRIATYTLWLAILTGALVVVSSIQICFLILAERKASNQIKLARSEFTASHRPRLRFRYALLTQFIPGQPCLVRVCICNVGETVAIPKRIGADVFIRSPESALLIDARPSDWTESYKEIPAGKEIVIVCRTRFPLPIERFNGIKAGVDALCMLMILSHADESGIERSTSIFKICVPAIERFRQCRPEDEYAEWDYED